jgi:hypothetical protein
MSAWLSGLFATAGAVFAYFALISWHKSAALLTEMRSALRALSSERSKIEENSVQLDSLADQLRALRGKFYAERRKSAEFDATPPSAADLKAQLRQQIGLVPGRRP